jgi:cytochrome c-type biogenesis protein
MAFSILPGISEISGIPVVAAFSLGLLMAVSPCPLATNIAAIAYVSQQAAERRQAAVTSALYTLGRILTYSVIGVLIIKLGLEIPVLARAVQSAGDKIIGPVLIVVGVVLLFADRLRFGNGGGLSSLGEKVSHRGMAGGFLLGIVFALAFCPYSAVLYFGVLIPLALKSTGGIGLPMVFAIATGLPVLIFGLALSFGVSRVSSWFNAITRAQNIIRIITSWVLIGIGTYYVVMWAVSG